VKRIFGRNRVLTAALLVAGGVWLADALTRGGPTPARAAQTAAPVVAPVINWPEIEEHVARLTRADYASVSADVDGLDRDLFAPSQVVADALAASAPPPVVELEDPQVSAEQDFRARHKLTGVIVGQRPLAVVDERLWPLGAEQDGFQLIEVQRDHAVFRHTTTDIRLTLELPRALPGKP
jgi:hypothetical protein